MAFCGNCGSKVYANDSFCPECGGKVNEGKVHSVNNMPYEPQQYLNQGYSNFYYPMPPASNGMAVAGFVLSFLVPFLGLIFSIIGLSKSKYMYGEGRGMSIAGIVISIVIMVVAIIIAISIIDNGGHYPYYR